MHHDFSLARFISAHLCILLAVKKELKNAILIKPPLSPKRKTLGNLVGWGGCLLSQI